MAMPKSLLITLEFPPFHGGGAHYYYNVVKHLPAGQVVVLAPFSLQAAAFDAVQPFTIVRDRRLNKLQRPSRLKLISWWRQLRLLGAIRETVKHYHIELIQVGNVLPLGTLAMLLRRKLPYLLYAHGLDILLPQRSRQKKRLLKRIITHARYIVANSRFTRDALLNLGASGEKIAVVYPCPHLSQTRISSEQLEQFRREHRLVGKRIILTVGRLVERKGHDQVIAALPSVLKRVPDAAYVIVGDGPYRSALQQLVRERNLGGHVTFLGRLDETGMATCLEACDVFAMPSRRIGADVEGFGMVYLEAALFGKPAIAGRSGGATEAVLNDLTGLTVDETDTAQVAHALINLLTNRAYADRLGFQAMQRTLEEFTWDRQVQKLIDLLR